jgi:hypothetical protein
MKRIAIAALIFVPVVIAYAFVDDLINGLPFTRFSPSWVTWAGGLFALGGDPWERGPGRIFRVAVAMFLLLGVVGACTVLGRSFR